jgi:hypothetical protein
MGLLLCYFAVLVFRQHRVPPQPHVARRSALNLMLVLAAVLQYIIVVTFEANATAKHLFIFNVNVDVCLFLAILDIVALVVALRLHAPAATSRNRHWHRQMAAPAQDLPNFPQDHDDLLRSLQASHLRRMRHDEPG